MPRPLDPDRPVADEWGRVVAAELRDAAAHLADGSPGGVHAARKALKRVRALLRLARGPLGPRYAAANREVRDLARELAPDRDAEAVREALRRLARSPAAPPAAAVKAVDAVLRARRPATTATGAPVPGRFRLVAERLEAVAVEFREEPLEGEGFALLAPGLERLLDAARRDWRRAEDGGGAAERHEWRKRVKHELAAVRFLEPLHPRRLARRRRELDRLAGMLGDEHDLGLLAALLAEAGKAGGPGAAAVRAAIPPERDRLVAEALDLGRRLFAQGRARRRVRLLARRWRKRQERSAG